MSDRIIISAIPRPMVPVPAAMCFFDLSEDDVLALIETGKLLWAWNLAAPGARRRYIRVWFWSVYAYSSDKPGIDDLPEDVVLSRLFRHSRPLLRTTEVQNAFCSSQTHVAQLIQSGQLALAGPRKARSGPNAFGYVTRASVEQFLRSQRIV